MSSNFIRFPAIILYQLDRLDYTKTYCKGERDRPRKKYPSKANRMLQQVLVRLCSAMFNKMLYTAMIRGNAESTPHNNNPFQLKIHIEEMEKKKRGNSWYLCNSPCWWLYADRVIFTTIKKNNRTAYLSLVLSMKTWLKIQRTPDTVQRSFGWVWVYEAVWGFSCLLEIK